MTPADQGDAASPARRDEAVSTGAVEGGNAAGPRDLRILAGQLGREARDVSGVACRCPYGYPAVIETGPWLAGEPNPTLLYLTCPSMVKAVSRVESTGGVKRFKEACGDDDDLHAVLARLTALYRARRDELGRAGAGGGSAAPGRPAGAAPAIRPEAGVGGPESPLVATCLHAHAAAMLAVFSGWLGSATGRGSVVDESLASRLETVWHQFLPPSDDCWCSDIVCRRWDSGSRAAAIDVGTISVRLLVADIEEGRPHTVVRRAEITRLGEGLRAGGPLKEAARARTAAVVARFASEAREVGADTIVLAATSAARDAADGAEFVALLGRANDVPAAVLSGRREARLAYTGASLDVTGDAVVLDIGGGSTEFTRREGRAGVASVSLDLGASRSTERWLKSDPPSREEVQTAFEDAVWILERLPSEFAACPSQGESVSGAATTTLVGVAGTITTLSCLDAGLPAYDSDAIHLRVLTLESVQKQARRLSGMSTAERAALPCVQAGRAPVLVGGAVILQAVMETLGYDRLTVSERDMLDGLVLCGLE